MANEQYYQSKIIKWFHKIGGTALTGQLPDGEADIQGGYPYRGRLLNVMVEVKTEVDYNRVMSGVEVVNERYVIIDRKKLKEHEPLQIRKLNRVRDRGGIALLAFSVSQVEDYIKADLARYP